MKIKCLLLALFYGVSFAQHADGARILGLFPYHGKSHFVMYREVMKSLAEAGHQVDIVSHFPLEKPQENYTDIINLAGTLPDMVNNMGFEAMKDFATVFLGAAIHSTGTQVCELLGLPSMQKLIKNPPQDPPYDLVVTELFFASCYLAFGRHLGIPVVALTSIEPMLHVNRAIGNSLNTAIVSMIPKRSVMEMNFLQRLLNTVVIEGMILQCKYYMAVQTDIVGKYFGPDMPDIKELEGDVSLYLVNSHPIIHGVRPLAPAIVEVAGIQVQDVNTPMEADLQKWLDESENGFIFFSFGSIARVETFPKKLLDEIYSALIRIAPLRVLMKVAKPEEMPPGLPENVRTLTWAPQVQILKHKNIRAFLTHGGLMGLQEAVTFGVPLIGVPLFADQPANLHMCKERGIAVYLDINDLTADKIVDAVNEVVLNSKYKINMAAMSRQFLDRPRTARETAVFWIEYILEHGKDALRSPAAELSWWQLGLLDVYGTIIAVVLTVLYIFKLILSFLFRCIFGSRRRVSASKKSK